MSCRAGRHQQRTSDAGREQEAAPAPTCIGAGRTSAAQPSISRTSPARGPFGDSSTENSTRWPSRSNSKTAPRTELRWKKCSRPFSSRMNPNPLSISKRAIVPVCIPRSSDSMPGPIPGSPHVSPGAAHRSRDDSYAGPAESRFGASVGASPPEVKQVARVTGRRGIVARRLLGRLLLGGGRRIRGPEVPAATFAHPELFGRPRGGRGRILHGHLVAATLTPDMRKPIAHDTDLSMRFGFRCKAAFGIRRLSGGDLSW